MDDKQKKYKISRWLTIPVYTLLGLEALKVLVCIGMLVVVLIEQLMNPTLAEIETEFQDYEPTNNTVVVIHNECLNFGYSEFYLESLAPKGSDTGDWFIYDKKLYFSYYEQEKKSEPAYCVIYECDFYGKNLKKLASVNIYKTDHYKMVEVYNNVFYISNGTELTNGTKLDVIYPLENKQEEIAYNGNAYDYVENILKQKTDRYIITEDDKKEIIIKDNQSLNEYVINEETFKNTEEGKSLLKFKDYGLECNISNDRILITARVNSRDFIDAPYVTYEYDIENNKLIFQNYCVAQMDSFKPFSC